MKKYISTLLLLMISLGHSLCTQASQPPAKRHRPAPTFRISQACLHQASSVQHVAQLVTMGADFYAKDHAGDTVLHKAIKSNNIKAIETIEALLNYEQSISSEIQEHNLILQQNAQGLLPVHLAAQQGLTQALQCILTHYPDVSYNYPLQQGPYKDCTPLDLACMFARKDMVQFLLNLDDIVVDTRLLFTTIPQNYITPLYHACTSQPSEIPQNTHKQRAAIAEYILEQYPESITIHCGQANDTPLHRACQHGNKELTTLLLARNANMAFVDNQGKTPYERLQTLNNDYDKQFISKLLYIFGHICTLEKELITDEERLLHAIAIRDTKFTQQYKPQHISPHFPSIVYILTALQDAYNNSNMLEKILELEHIPVQKNRKHISTTITNNTRHELIFYFVHHFNEYLQKKTLFSSLSQTPNKDIVITFSK